MVERSVLLQEIDSLPPKYFGEVLDFVGYLRQKAQNESGNDAARDSGQTILPLGKRPEGTYDAAYMAMAADTERETEAREWCTPLYGLARSKGATLTLDRFMEMQHEEIAREIESDQRLLGKQ